MKFSGIKAVTFDVGGTLINPWPSVGDVYVEVAAELECRRVKFINWSFRMPEVAAQFRLLSGSSFEIVRESLTTGRGVAG